METQIDRNAAAIAHAELVDRAVSDITYPHDGPVTRFVAIHRALSLVESGKCTADVAANALEVWFECDGGEDAPSPYYNTADGY